MGLWHHGMVQWGGNNVRQSFPRHMETVLRSEGSTDVN